MRRRHAKHWAERWWPKVQLFPPPPPLPSPLFRVSIQATPGEGSTHLCTHQRSHPLGKPDSSNAAPTQEGSTQLCTAKPTQPNWTIIALTHQEESAIYKDTAQKRNIYVHIIPSKTNISKYHQRISRYVETPIPSKGEPLPKKL